VATDVITAARFERGRKAGKTTVGDVRWWMLQQVNNLASASGSRLIFVSAAGAKKRTDAAIPQHGGRIGRSRRGDLIHVDFGLIYMASAPIGKSTDISSSPRKTHPRVKGRPQEHKPLQDILFSFARPA
jgi:hypothetical protein